MLLAMEHCSISSIFTISSSSLLLVDWLEGVVRMQEVHCQLGLVLQRFLGGDACQTWESFHLAMHFSRRIGMLMNRNLQNLPCSRLDCQYVAVHCLLPRLVASQAQDIMSFAEPSTEGMQLLVEYDEDCIQAQFPTLTCTLLTLLCSTLWHQSAAHQLVLGVF